MEIVVERIAKKETYTIGRLYLLADGDVKRKALSGKTAGDKRSFEHSFDLEKLSKDSYFCDTLEPTWRNLKGVELQPGEVNARFSRESGKVARKIPGRTAIPEGSYRVLITKSPRFKKWLPYVQGVPGFEGIRIHAVEEFGVVSSFFTLVVSAAVSAGLSAFSVSACVFSVVFSGLTPFSAQPLIEIMPERARTAAIDLM